MTTDNIWVKRGVGISGFGLPLVVMAAAKQGQQHWVGEYYIFLGGQYPGFLYQGFSVKAVDVPAEVATVDGEYMRAELDLQVLGRVSAHCFDLYEKTNRAGLLQRIEWVDGEPLDVLRAWMRNEHQDSIKKMREFTRVDALKSALKDLDHLPVIRINAQS